MFCKRFVTGLSIAVLLTAPSLAGSFGLYGSIGIPRRPKTAAEAARTSDSIS